MVAVFAATQKKTSPFQSNLDGTWNKHGMAVTAHRTCRTPNNQRDIFAIRAHLSKLIRWWCWPPAFPQPPGCLRCFPIRPWPVNQTNRKGFVEPSPLENIRPLFLWPCILRLFLRWATILPQKCQTSGELSTGHCLPCSLLVNLSTWSADVQCLWCTVPRHPFYCCWETQMFCAAPAYLGQANLDPTNAAA